MLRTGEYEAPEPRDDLITTLHSPIALHPSRWGSAQHSRQGVYSGKENWHG